MNLQNKTWVVNDEDAMVAFGAALGKILAAQPHAATLFLSGNLGAGKTTLSRGILRGFGHTGSVKSPTYTLVEVYEFGARHVYHFDLYRLGNAEELEYMGIRDYFNSTDICLLEWPDRGAGYLPEPDFEIEVSINGTGRFVTASAVSPLGNELLQLLMRAVPQ